MITKRQRLIQRIHNWLIDHEGDVLASCVIGMWLSAWLLAYAAGR